MATDGPLQSLQGTLLLETGDVACEVIGRSPVGIEVRSERVLAQTTRVRLMFAHEGAHPGDVRVLASVDSNMVDDDGAVLQLRLLALHSSQGTLCLTGFLVDDLGVPRVDTAAFKQGANGWFYRFQDRWGDNMGNDQTVRSIKSVDVSLMKRREERVAVRVPVTLEVAGERFKGQAYNVSYSGVYILTEDVLPPVSTDIVVLYPLQLDGEAFETRLRGEVVWSMAGMDSTVSGGLGILLNAAEDGAAGAAWRDYVAQEADFGESIPLADG